MRSLPPDRIVPGSHCRDANNAYLRIRHVLAEGRPSDVGGGDADFEPCALEMGEDNATLVAGRRWRNGVYATLCDAFVAHRDILTSPDYVFRGHADSQWALVPTRRRFKTAHAQDFYDSCRSRFVEKAKALLDQPVEDLELRSLCQHYGICTDLLDLTEHFEVAAHFAQRGRATTDSGCIWVFRRDLLEKSGRFVHHSNLPREGALNQRILRQGGCFVSLETDEATEWITGQGVPIVFSQFTQTPQHFQLNGRRVTQSLLFPPDFEDGIAAAASDTLAECRSAARTIQCLETCSERRCDGERNQIRMEMSPFMEEHDPGGLVEWLYRHKNARPPRNLLILEELAWHGRLSLLQGFLTWCPSPEEGPSLDLRSYAPWRELVVESVIRGAGSLRELNDKEVDAVWSLLKLLLNADWWDTSERIIEVFDDSSGPLFDKGFAERRHEISLLVQRNLQGLPLGLSCVDRLVAWFWHDPEPAVQATLREILDECRAQECSREG